MVDPFTKEQNENKFIKNKIFVAPPYMDGQGCYIYSEGIYILYDYLRHVVYKFYQYMRCINKHNIHVLLHEEFALPHMQVTNQQSFHTMKFFLSQVALFN